MNEIVADSQNENVKLNNEVSRKIVSRINFKNTFLAILPLMIAQIVQRFYPIIDNHYIAYLGTQALLIHNVQYSFINLGQYIGGATAVSCLIFWNRADYVERQSNVFYLHISLCVSIACICMLVASYFARDILVYFSVEHEYFSLALKYFNIGLCNMVLQAIYLALIGIVIAVNKERLSLIFSVTLLPFTIVEDSLAVHWLFSGEVTPQQIAPTMYTIILSSTSLLIICIGIMLYLLRKKIKQISFSHGKEIFKIWTNELGGAFISSVYPIFYLFQLGLIKTSGSLLVTYQLLMQLTAVFCIPILATMQVSLRDASAIQGLSQSRFIPIWVRELIYFGLIPTEILLAVFMFFPIVLIQFVFGYVTPIEHLSYIVIYLFASMIGQIGNAFTVSIRAKKNSHLVTTGYFISDVIVLVGGTQLLFFARIATPTTAGIVMLVYTCIYTLINAYFAMRK